MKSLDVVQMERVQILQRMTEAVQANDTERFLQAFGDLADAIGESIRGDVLNLLAAQDNSIRQPRAVRMLLSWAVFTTHST